MPSYISRAIAGLALLAFAALSQPLHARVINTITSDADVERFVRDIQVPNARVTIAGNVNLDLSGRKDLYVAPGVQIIGDRSVYPRGPRIFSTSPNTGAAINLFIVGDEWRGASDGVRISGIRFDGGAGNEHSNKVALSIRSSVDVEIDDNEFSGWGRAAVEVVDRFSQFGDRITLANASTVHVHDNYIHNNQEPLGYGVVTGGGAYALIERNVFFNNRHSIAGDGSDGSGYLVYRNLILANDGFNRTQQQIDMHGQENCDGDRSYSCGPAGEYMDVRYNTVQHTQGLSFLLRGTPAIRADVVSNVFALPKFFALRQNQGSNLRETNNAFSASADNGRYCDFDGDGAVDLFMATGATWWYRSTLSGYRWTYLSQSTKQGSALTLRDVNGDGRCDVSIAGTVYHSGVAPSRSADVLWRKADHTTPFMWQLAADGNVYSTRTPGTLGVREEIRAAGDFDGDGDGDLFTRTNLDGVLHRVLFEDGVATRDTQADVATLATKYFVGDFDGDGADDLLRQIRGGSNTTPQTNGLEIWFSGMALRSATPTWANQGGALELLWDVRGVGDFNGDGKDDILFIHPHDGMAIWLMNGSRWIADMHPPKPDQTGIWDVAGVGDFDADGRDDILQRDLRGMLALWLAVNGQTAFPTYRNEPGRRVENDWLIENVADFNNDGRADILWHHRQIGLVGFWTMSGGTFTGEFYPGNDGGGTWILEAVMPLEKPTSGTEPGRNSPRVPNLWGQTLPQAVQSLSALGLVLGEVGEVENCDVENSVADQSPGPVKVAPGTRVNLWLGKRPPPPRSCQ